MSHTIRPLHPADAARALWNRSVPLWPMTPALWAEMVDAEVALVATEAGGAAHGQEEVVGLAVGARWPVADGMRGSVRLLAVDPAHRRRGLGTALLDAVAEALGQRGATVLRLGEGAPVYLTPGIDLREAAGLAFADARGFAPIGEAVHLGVALGPLDTDTEADGARLAEAGVTVRRATPSDHAPLARLLDAAWPAWHPEVAHALANDPPSVHLAVRGADVLGFAAHSSSHAGMPWFGPMGTAPAARGLGVGAVLLRHCLADLREAGHAQATIAWAASLPFYEKAVGATVSHRFRRVERAL